MVGHLTKALFKPCISPICVNVVGESTTVPQLERCSKGAKFLSGGPTVLDWLISKKKVIAPNRSNFLLVFC